MCFLNVLETPSTERTSSPVGEFLVCSLVQDFIPLYLNQSLKNTWKSGVSFKGIKIFYCDTEDRQIAISHFTVFSGKKCYFIVQEKHVCHGIIQHFPSLWEFFFFWSIFLLPGSLIACKLVNSYNTEVN